MGIQKKKKIKQHIAIYSFDIIWKMFFEFKGCRWL